MCSNQVRNKVKQMHELGKEKTILYCLDIPVDTAYWVIRKYKLYQTSQTCERSHREANNNFEGAPEFRSSEQDKGAAVKRSA